MKQSLPRINFIKLSLGKSAQYTLDAAKTQAQKQLGAQPDMVNDMEGALAWAANFTAKIKTHQDKYDGTGRGIKQSCVAYSNACRRKLGQAIDELETKYECAKSINDEELAKRNYKDLNALRTECEISCILVSDSRGL